MAAGTYDCWLFDLDGTVVDVDPSYSSEVFTEVGDRLGHEFTDRERTRLWHGLGGTRNALLDGLGVDVDRFWREFDDVADPSSRADATFVYDDAAGIADIDAPVGLVTHCPRPTTDAVLSRLDIEDWFDSVVCCTGAVGMKPDPAPVRTAMRSLNVDDAGTTGLLAGDSRHDVAAAANAGLDSAHVERHDPGFRGCCVLADYRVTGLDEILGVSPGPSPLTRREAGAHR